MPQFVMPRTTPPELRIRVPAVRAILGREKGLAMLWNGDGVGNGTLLLRRWILVGPDLCQFGNEGRGIAKDLPLLSFRIASHLSRIFIAGSPELEPTI